jgi:ankyrin repeat protein
MKKIFFAIAAQVLILTFAAAGFAQTGETLDERLAKTFNEQFPEWKTQNQSKPFQAMLTSHEPSIEAQWKNGETKLHAVIRLFDSPAKARENFRWFFMRQIMPPNRKLSGIGEEAYLVETAYRADVAFAKENVFAVLYTDFPNEKKPKNAYPYEVNAPKAEVDRITAIARVLADAIAAQKTVAPCSNDFFRLPFGAENTAEEKFLASASRGETEQVKKFIAQNINLKATAENGDSALHLAVRQGCPTTVRALIDVKADVNAKNGKGETPLMIAARYGEAETVKLLLAAGADVQAEVEYGATAATYVLSTPDGYFFGKTIPGTEEKLPILKILQDAGLDLKKRDTFNKYTLLNIYLENSGNSENVINALLDFGIDVNASPSGGRTALIGAMNRLNSYSKRNEVIKLLISRGADVNQKDTRGWSALTYARKNDERYSKSTDEEKERVYNAETIRILIEAGAKE